MARHPQHGIGPHLLRDHIVDRPDQLWCVGIPYIPMRRGLICLRAVMA